MPQPFRILVVCTANMCRSPLAAHLIADQLASAGLADVTRVESAGTDADPGSPMCAQAAAWPGAHPQGHAARPVTKDLLEQADLVLPAERSHRAVCARLDPACRPRMLTLTQAADLAEAIAASLSSGTLPDDAPALPDDPVERLRWLVGEMDAARGIRAGRPEADDDIADRHGQPDHHDTFVEVDATARRLARALVDVATRI